jgi:hypothetical protein
MSRMREDTSDPRRRDAPPEPAPRLPNPTKPGKRGDPPKPPPPLRRPPAPPEAPRER